MEEDGKTVQSEKTIEELKAELEKVNDELTKLKAHAERLEKRLKQYLYGVDAINSLIRSLA